MNILFQNQEVGKKFLRAIKGYLWDRFFAPNTELEPNDIFPG
jgi:hypothetical protein